MRYDPKLSALVNGNVWIDGRRTSIRMEPEFWAALRAIPEYRIGRDDRFIDWCIAGRKVGSQTSAIRCAILAHYMGEAFDKTEESNGRALRAAMARGRLLKQNMMSDPEMLRSAEIAERLGIPEECVRLDRRRHEMLGLELTKDDIRYPAWQITEGRGTLPGLPRLFDALGDSPWTVYRFLLQHHAELDGARALDALRKGRTDSVIAAAENVARGGYSGDYVSAATMPD